MVDVSRCRRDDVEIVEQPFSRRRRGLQARVVCQCCVETAQRPDVSFESPEVSVSAAWLRRDREQRRQTSGVLLQKLNAQEFLAGTEQARCGERRTPHEHSSAACVCASPSIDRHYSAARW